MKKEIKEGKSYFFFYAKENHTLRTEKLINPSKALASHCKV